METVIARKQGNAVAITIAKKFNVNPGETYLISKQENGTIILVPKVPDIFENVELNEYFDADTDNLVKDVQLRGAELSD
ncbi:type II toxin-antitoxin system PemI/MazE family antitoxin [Ligilactobacillus salivarius]|uniref:type II toxin-antitoxin system PemI/MazE family antitoxin n=1 Tax=Ligilactobacillus salivarius TaxID=1624 RepID=UPI00155245B8|nr:AbrB family transcriptional regulator [Ligilactobacillus salivarius]